MADDQLYSKISGISPISPEAFAQLLQHSTKRQWQKGEYLLREGSICRMVHFIERGAMRAFQVKDGKDIHLNFYFEGAFVTNLKSLRTETPSAYHLQAMEQALVYSFTKTDLLELYACSPEVAVFGKNLVEHLLMEQEEHAAFFKLYSPEERYMQLLQQHPALIQRVSLSRLASYLGIARESLSRIRKRIQ